jgi:glutathionyl-hydroquinone reductase
MGTNGWPFASVDPFPGADKDPLYGSEHIKDLYLRTKPDYDGRFTVPVLWDTKHETIVNNESSEIIRIFYTAFDSLLPEDKRTAKLDFYPEAHRKEIDEINEWVYDKINSEEMTLFLGRNIAN